MIILCLLYLIGFSVKKLSLLWVI